MNRFFPLNVIVLLFTGFTKATAQESISSAGGETSGSGGFVSYSVGQLFYRISTGQVLQQHPGV